MGPCARRPPGQARRRYHERGLVKCRQKCARVRSGHAVPTISARTPGHRGGAFARRGSGRPGAARPQRPRGLGPGAARGRVAVGSAPRRGGQAPPQPGALRGAPRGGEEVRPHRGGRDPEGALRARLPHPRSVRAGREAVSPDAREATRGEGADPSRAIFINYRREDSGGQARALLYALERAFPGQVFMDVKGLAPGVNYLEEIEHTVGSCKVVLVLIGKGWAGVTDAAGRRRLKDPRDVVALEIGTALRRPDVLVVPVLVGGAALPA